MTPILGHKKLLQWAQLVLAAYFLVGLSTGAIPILSDPSPIRIQLGLKLAYVAMNSSFALVSEQSARRVLSRPRIPQV